MVRHHSGCHLNSIEIDKEYRVLVLRLISDRKMEYYSHWKSGEASKTNYI